MLASRADSFLSGFIEVFYQPDKPPKYGGHGPRSLASCGVSLRSNKQQVDGRARKKMLWIADAGRSATCIYFNYLASL